MSRITLPDFLRTQIVDNKITSSPPCSYHQNPCWAICQNCQTTCERKCEDCQSGCQSLCQRKCQNCQTTCERVCQGCQTTCEKKCQNCQTACELECQNCQTACQLKCQNCQTACELSCQNCQSGCQLSCQTACQAGCQDCQTACQLACQNCQTTCEISYQHVHEWKVRYVQIKNNNTHHERHTYCVSCDDVIIENQRHTFDENDYYEDGWLVERCHLCGYVKKVSAIPDFEWTYNKGSNTSDVLVTAEEWNRFLVLLSYKLRSANKAYDLDYLQASPIETLITAQLFNGVIDKLNLIKAKNIPSKVAHSTLVLSNTHLNGIKDSLNGVRYLR